MSDTNSKKIVYSNRPLKSNERYATLQEFLDHHQYLPLFGIKKLDAAVINKQELKSKSKKLSRDKIVVEMIKFNARKNALMKKIESEKNPDDKKKLEDELAKVLPELRKYNEMFNDIERKRDKEVKPQPPQIDNTNIKKLNEAMAMLSSTGKKHELTKAEFDQINKLIKTVKQKPINNKVNQKPLSKFAMVNALSKLQGDNINFLSTKGEYDFWSKQIQKEQQKKKPKKETAKTNTYSDSQLLEIYKLLEEFDDRIFSEIDYLENNIDDDEDEEKDDKIEQLQMFTNIRNELLKIQGFIKKKAKVMLRGNKVISLTNNQITTPEFKKLIKDTTELISNISYEKYLWDNALEKPVIDFINKYKHLVNMDEHFVNTNIIHAMFKRVIRSKSK